MLLTFCPISKGTLQSQPEAARATSLWSSGDSIVDAINEGIVREIADQGKASLHLYLKLLCYLACISFCLTVEGIAYISSMLVDTAVCVVGLSELEFNCAVFLNVCCMSQGLKYWSTSMITK